MSACTHHILCAGKSGVAFARLAAEALYASCPMDERRHLSIFLHLDAMPERFASEVGEWFADAPAVRTTFGLLQVGDPAKAINWHQRMINRIAHLFQSESRIAFVDADLFLVDSSWWQVLQADEGSGRLYAHTHGLRKERRFILPGAEFTAMKTVLFSLDPGLHCAINTQVLNSDKKAAAKLVRDFPGSRLEAGLFVDTQVVASLRAQALGYAIEDVSAQVAACHVGGFSHINPDKLRGGSSTVAQASWLKRLRLFEAVIAHLRERGWDRFLDTAHIKTAARMRTIIDEDEQLREQFASLAPSTDELAFAGLLKKGLVG